MDKHKHQFTPLTAPLREVYAHIGADLPEPRKMKTFDKMRDNSKYCWYHKDCWTLKEEIEKLIQRGQLRQYIDKKKSAPKSQKIKGKASQTKSS